MATCSETNRNRLFVGPGSLQAAQAFLSKNKGRQPYLGNSIVVAEAPFYENASEEGSCRDCKNLSGEDLTAFALANFFAIDQKRESYYCSKRCETIEELKNKGVTIIFNFDETQMDKSCHPAIQGKKFSRIHWMYPSDPRHYKGRTPASAAEKFFMVVTGFQNYRAKVHITLNLSKQRNFSFFFEGIEHAANSEEYQLRLMKNPGNSLGRLTFTKKRRCKVQVNNLLNQHITDSDSVGYSADESEEERTIGETDI